MKLSELAEREDWKGLLEPTYSRERDPKGMDILTERNTTLKDCFMSLGTISPILATLQEQPSTEKCSEAIKKIQETMATLDKLKRRLREMRGVVKEYRKENKPQLTSKQLEALAKGRLANKILRGET